MEPTINFLFGLTYIAGGVGAVVLLRRNHLDARDRITAYTILPIAVAWGSLFLYLTIVQPGPVGSVVPVWVRLNHFTGFVGIALWLLFTQVHQDNR